MKTVRDACVVQKNAFDINVGDQIEQLDQIISATDGNEYFAKTFITDGMRALLSKGIARLAGKTNDSIFHLKQAMGGGKTHLMVGFGLLAKDPALRNKLISDMPYQASFKNVKIAAFNGRNNPPTFLWGEIAKQLGKESLFKEFWESGAKAPDETAWLKLFDGDDPVLILLDEMPPYFHYLNTQASGMGTVADVLTRAFANMLTAAQKKKNVCIVVSDLEAAYATGGKLIQKSLDDAKQEIGRAEISITPVNLESSEIYEILRKRLFVSLPDKSVIQDIAQGFAKKLGEAAKAKAVERSAESLADEIMETYPFHPRFKNLVALFKENEKFKQTRGLMELVSRLLKSVWERSENDVFLIGAQHFNLNLPEVREKLSDISDMRDVIAMDLWNQQQAAHAQLIDINTGRSNAAESGTLLLTASLSTAVNAVKGLTDAELLECLISPLREPSDYRIAFTELHKVAWYLHQTVEGRYYFDRQENLTKKLQGYADKAPQNKVDELIRLRLTEMYSPKNREAYEKVIPLPVMDEAEAQLKQSRTLLIVSPDGKIPPEVVNQFFESLTVKNNLLVLTGEKSQFASVEKAARHLYAVMKADNEIAPTHPQRKELDEKKAQYEQDFQTTILSVFDKLFFPGAQGSTPVLRSKALDTTYPSNETYNGERQIVKTLTTDPIKLYTDVSANFDALKSRAETLLFGNQNDIRKSDMNDKMKQQSQMPWIPPKGLEILIQDCCQRGLWEDLGNGYITKKPKPKATAVQITKLSEPDDSGHVRIKIDTLNAGPAPRVHFTEDGPVSENAPVLKENELVTNALRVQFLVVDPTGKNITGNPVTWENTLVLRNRFDELNRKVELFVAPRGNIFYSLDGSEPRNGTPYDAPVTLLERGEVKMLCFAECEGLEARREFVFKAEGEKGISLVRTEPATIYTVKPKRLDSSAKTYEGLTIAREKGVEFEQVVLTIGSGSKVVTLTLGEIRLKAEVVEKLLTDLTALVSPESPVTMQFKRAHFATGFDLEQFAQKLGIDIEQNEVQQ
jgi:hypothetical protein